MTSPVSLKLVGSPTPSSHITFGEVAIPQLSLEIQVSALAENTGTGPGRLAIRFELWEVKAFAFDEKWIEYTPIASEGGPANIRDIVAVETVQSTTLEDTLPLVQPGQTLPAITKVTLPGRSLSGMQAFWDSHAGAPFKVIAELIQLELDTNVEIASFGRHIFEDAFRLVAGAPTTFQTIGQATLLVRST